MTRSQPKTGRTSAAASGAPTARIGLYLTTATFNEARSAYLADWQNGGEADTFVRWIAAAMEAHAARSSSERIALARPVSVRGQGDTRSFTVPAATVRRMRAAIAEDNAAGHWPSESAWCVDAINVQIAAARLRSGGDLPVPPTRLPNRLVR